MFADFFTPPEGSWAAYLLYATGSKQFNKQMRGIAKNKGYKLNQHGIYKDKLIETNTEADIFEILNMPFIEPYKRSI